MCEKREDLCRTCLVGNKNMFNIFASGSEADINLADMLMSFVPIKINHDEDLPHSMCSDCIKTLTTSYNFKKQCERSDVLLRSQKTETKIKKENTIEVVMADNFVSEDENENEHEDESIVNIFDEYDDINKKFKCSLCPRAFRKSGTLNLHMKTHTENNECIYCNVILDSYEALLKHNKQNHRFFKCTFCDKSYATGNALNAHMRMHKSLSTNKAEENAEYICVVGIDDTSKRIVDVDDTDDTSKRFKKPKFEGEVEMSEKNNIVNCDQCNLPCINEEMLQLHEKIHEENHECNKCELIFMAYSDFVDHNKTTHSIYNCSKCVKSFPTIYGLSGHSSAHVVAEENPCIMYKCTIPDCNKKYRTLEYLKQHTLTHTNENKVYLCKICGKVYNSSNSFYYHKRLHMDSRPYICTYCGNAYKISSHLKTHMWRHSNVMPHRCTKCGKGFTRRRALRKHMESNCGSKKRRKRLIMSSAEKEDVN